MKKQNKNLPMPSKWRKRTAAVATAAMMLLSSTPISPLYETFSGWISNFSITAKAAEEDWVIASHIYPINSASDLSKYSVAYHLGLTDHTHDTLEINFTGETASLSDYEISPFYSIGENAPFRGTITINDNSLNYINIDKAFFAQIGEEAVIKADSTGSNALIISRSAASTDPIFAKKVVAAESGATTSGATFGWNINTKTYYDNGNVVNSNVDSLIGEIEGGCTVKVSFTDERCMNVVSTGSTGYICGKLGDGATLEIGSVTSSGVTVSTSGSGKHAGAIIGEMGSGATMKLPYDMASFPVTTITASNGYAGGIVGCNNGGEIAFTTPEEGVTDSTQYTVNQEINGKIGSGGIYGYYCPALTNSAASLSYDDINVACTLKGAGGSGGLFGVLYNNNGSITLSDATGDADHITVNNAGATTNYGGLIGSYSAASLDDTLTLSSGCTSKPSQGGSSTYYGGAIGAVSGKAYVCLNDFSTVASDANKFGGAVGDASAAYIDVNGITVDVSTTNASAGIVYALGNGVLRMDGTIDLSTAKVTTGQIVGTRDCGLVFAEPTLKLYRYSTLGIDDIGTWGEVVRFQNSGFTKTSVLTQGTHYVTLLGAETSMDSASDFAVTAMNIQHNTDTITDADAVLRFTTGATNKSSTLLGTNLSLSGGFSLSNTGMTGLTRDNGGTGAYTGTFDGGGYTLTLAIGEGYGYYKPATEDEDDIAVANNAAGSGRIYKHSHVGLFGSTNGATIQNVTLDGNIYVSSATTQYVGAAAAENAGGFTAYGVTVSTAMHHSGSSQLCMGGLLGRSTSGNYTIGAANTSTATNACTLTMDITGTNSADSTCIGGAIGLVHTAAFTGIINNVTVSGTIACGSKDDGSSGRKTRQQMGGLIGYIEKSTTSGRSLSVDAVTVSDLTLRGIVGHGNGTDKGALSMGGLLGYGWFDTDVALNSVTIGGTPMIDVYVDNLNDINVDTAGLVYAGTGSWTVGTVSIPSISVNTYTKGTDTKTTNIRSCGLIVNRGWHESAALYLVLPNMANYTLGTSSTALSQVTNFPSFNSTTVFDELVAYSAIYEEDSTGVRTSKVLENGQGIVSIRTRGNTATVNNVMKTNTCNTYQNQVVAGTNGNLNMGNPNTRYYYDLDLLLTKKDNATATTPTATLTSSDKLMLWSLHQYAHTSLNDTSEKPFYYNPFSDNAIAPTGSQTFDMDGYSYYPVNVSGATINGTFKLYNQAIEYGEDGKTAAGVDSAFTPTDGYARTTLNESGSAFTTTPYTQHHLMQNGIFLNANGAIVVNGVLTLQGTIGADTYSDTGSGALICGTLQGYLDSNNEAVYASLTSEDLKNESGVVTADCEIVLDGIKVHNIGDRTSTVYAPLLVNRIDSYTNVSLEDVYVKDSSSYGTSGAVAASSLIGDAGTSTESCNINLTFSAIKLDGRSEAISSGNSDLTTAYGTSLSIFTKATLLNKYQYYTGSSGKYNYMLSEDWGSDGSGNRFVTYGKEVGYDNNTENSEWGNKEQRYLAEAGSTDNPFFTHPDEMPTASSSKYGSFGKFLPYVATAYDGDTKHELKVNHGKTSISGCGTYNDPYLITDGQQLVTIANIIAGNHDGAIVCMPINTDDFNTKWHGSGGHTNYVYNLNNDSLYARADNGKSKIATNNIIQYLCSAYYKINEDIELPADFVGLGSNANTTQAFRGVIVGNNKPTITNKSQNPLILNSNGSVVKDVTIKVSNTGITTVDVASASTAFGVNANREAYGAVIGKIHGGDNIIDNVGVTFDTGTAITVASKRTPVGGYVGVEIAGALIFRNMSTNKNGLTSTQCSNVSDDSYLYVNPIIGRVINAYAVTEANAYHPFENTTRNGYTSGNAVTMRNGTKNYSITDIVKETRTNGVTTPYSMLQIGAYNAVSITTNKTTVTFPNAQSVFILSCLIQDGITANSADSYSNSNTNIQSYSTDNKTTHVSRYRGIGLTTKIDGEDTIITDKAAYATANAQAKADYDLAITDSHVVVNATANTPVTSKTVSPYLVQNYVDSANRNGIFRLTNTATVCDIGFSGTAGTWYLPDGFRGLGSVAFGSNENQVKAMTLSVNRLNGLIGSNVVNLDLNMNLKHYDYGFDNYKPFGKAGWGLFNTIRNNRTDQTPDGEVPLSLEGRTDDDYKIMYLGISGTINYDVVHNTGSMEYTRVNALGGSGIDSNYLHVGGLAGYSGFGSNENLNVEHIDIDGLTVNGFKTAGGIFGYLYMADSSKHLATISNIATDDLTVTTKLYAGGIVGYANQIGLTIAEVEIANPDIRTYFVGNDYENGTAGIVGCVKNTANNRPITISNVTIGSLDTNANCIIGRDESVPLYDTGTGNNDKYNKIAAAGIIGESYTNSSTFNESLSPKGEYSLIVDRCHVYNVNFYGNRVAGILAHDGSGTSGGSYSTIKISNVELKSTCNSTIEGMTFATDYQNRGCGGIAGYIKFADSNRYVHFDHCTIENYTLKSYNDTAGLCANIQDKGEARLQNIKLKNIKIQSHYAGGIFGYAKIAINGYNIQMDNLQFKKLFSNKGYLRMGNAFLIVKTAGSTIKIAGLSRQDPSSADDGYELLDNMTSVNSNNNAWDKYAYGTNGYVIFADYNGASSTEKKNDWCVHEYNLPTSDEDIGEISDVAQKKLNEYNTFSPIIRTGSSNVSISSQDYVTLPKTVEVNGTTRFITDKDGNTITYKDYYNIAQNFPFVTSSPFMNIGINSVGTDANGNSRNHMQFLTGDGVSSLTYADSAANAILDDLQLTTKPKNYYNQITLDAETLDDLLAEKYSTFQTIMSTQYPADLRTLGINFPVLIVDNTNGSYLNTFLNGYLQTLTNTNYTFSANNQSSIYNLRIAKCEYNSPNKNFDVTYKSSLTDTPATDGVSLYTKNGNFLFDINHVDSGKVQFTLIDVEFYNPGTTEVAYHLYVPLYVSQMLKFDFQVSSKSGSNYKLTEYTSDRGNSTLENAGTPITIEARYVYQRDESEWKQAAENGENLLRSIPKTWDISDQATHHGFPADTKMVLIDPNNGNKAYYSSVTGGQVYGDGDDAVTDQTELGGAVSKLYLNKFVDLSGETTFVSTQLNDYFNITIAASNANDGKFIACSDQTNHSDATICGTYNGTTVWLKPKTDETSGSFYNISTMTYKSTAPTVANGSKTYLKEDYYVTIFTKNDGNLYHWNIVAPDNLGESQYPSLYSRLDNQKTKQSTQIVTGDLFVITDEALTTVIHEGSNGTYVSKTANDVDIASRITVDVTNKIGMTSQMFDNKSFLGNSSVHIYQTFLLSMNKQTGINESSRGIEAKPAVEMHEYTVGTYDVLTDTSNSYYTRYQGATPRYDSNYIYLENGKDLRQMLYNSNSGVSGYEKAQGVTIHANLYLTYSNTGDITNQYPQREEAQLNDNTIGTWIGCNSSIASTEAAAIASKTTDYIAEPTNSRNLYYSRSSSTASLLYSSDDFDGKYSGGNLYDQLGINAKDLPTTVTNNMCPMNTVVVYDVSKLMSIIDDSAGVELTFRLVRKDANGKYTQDLDIAEYLTDPTFKTLTVTKDASSSNSKIYIYRFEKANLAGVYNGGVYTIPIDFTVKTNFSGTDLTDHYYSNYKVIVSASLYEMKEVEVDGETETRPVQMSGTTADDHIIYTNAKIDESVFD